MQFLPDEAPFSVLPGVPQFAPEQEERQQPPPSVSTTSPGFPQATGLRRLFSRERTREASSSDDQGEVCEVARSGARGRLFSRERLFGTRASSEGILHLRGRSRRRVVPSARQCDDESQTKERPPERHVDACVAPPATEAPQMPMSQLAVVRETQLDDGQQGNRPPIRQNSLRQEKWPEQSPSFRGLAHSSRESGKDALEHIAKLQQSASGDGQFAMQTEDDANSADSTKSSVSDKASCSAMSSVYVSEGKQREDTTYRHPLADVYAGDQEVAAVLHQRVEQLLESNYTQRIRENVYARPFFAAVEQLFLPPGSNVDSVPGVRWLPTPQQLGLAAEFEACNYHSEAAISERKSTLGDEFEDFGDDVSPCCSATREFRSAGSADSRTPLHDVSDTFESEQCIEPSERPPTFRGVWVHVRNEDVGTRHRGDRMRSLMKTVGYQVLSSVQLVPGAPRQRITGTHIRSGHNVGSPSEVVSLELYFGPSAPLSTLKMVPDGRWRELQLGAIRTVGLSVWNKSELLLFMLLPREERDLLGALRHCAEAGLAMSVPSFDLEVASQAICPTSCELRLTQKRVPIRTQKDVNSQVSVRIFEKV